MKKFNMKKLLLIIAIILAALQTFSQSDPLRDKLDSVFQNVNKNVISTGYLKEYGAELMPIHVFNGVLTKCHSSLSPYFNKYYLST